MPGSKSIVLFALLATAACAARPAYDRASTPARSIALSPSEIARRATPSIVRIETDIGSERLHGAGFVVDAQGTIATNLHVIDGARDIVVIFEDGRRVSARAVTLPPSSVDLALVHIQSGHLKALPLGSGATSGDHVVMVGNRHGRDRPVSDGVVSGINGGDGALQVAAANGSGPSGRPTLNDRGEVVGITARADGELQVSIPVGQLKELLASDLTPLTIPELRLTERHQPNAYAAEVTRLSEACAQGKTIACNKAGFMFHHAKGMRDDSKSASFYSKACDRHDLQGCSNLAMLYKSGEGLTRDPRRAFELYEKSCVGGVKEACTAAGDLSREGSGVVKTASRALRFYTKGCNAGDFQGCMSAAAVYETSHRQVERVGWLLQRACDGNLAKACTKLGTLTQDAERAVSVFRRGCEKGDIEGCAYVGKALVEARGMPASVAQGVEYLRRGCKAGMTWSCEKLQAVGEKN